MSGIVRCEPRSEEAAEKEEQEDSGADERETVLGDVAPGCSSSAGLRHRDRSMIREWSLGEQRGLLKIAAW